MVCRCQSPAWYMSSLQLCWLEGRATWTITAVNPTRSDFVLVRENSNDFAWRRTFNEDRPGRDEVYALAVVRDHVDGTNLSEWARSNTVTGRY